MEIGRFIQQKEGYKAFIPNKFTPDKGFNFSKELILKHSTAERLLGKLDGITQLLPDVDFFLRMYIRKDAASGIGQGHPNRSKLCINGAVSNRINQIG